MSQHDPRSPFSAPDHAAQDPDPALADLLVELRALAAQTEAAAASVRDLALALATPRRPLPIYVWEQCAACEGEGERWALDHALSYAEWEPIERKGICEACGGHGRIERMIDQDGDGDDGGDV